LIFPYIRKGRIGAYQKILTRILSVLSSLEHEELLTCLSQTLRTGRLTIPKEINFLNKDIWTMPHVPMYYLVRVIRPSVVVETGVWTGKSSWFMLQALADNMRGTLLSIDLGTKAIRLGSKTSTLPTKAIGDLVPKSLRNRWKLLIGDSSVLLPKITSFSSSDSIKEIDLFFHDSDHSYNHLMFELNAVWPIISEGGFLCSDDIAESDAWSDFLKGVNHKGFSVESRLGISRKNAPVEEGFLLPKPVSSFR
jgi:predicted O-methyltransferase YrrM